MDEDELEYGIEDFDAIGDRFVDVYDDVDDYIEDEPLDTVAIAFKYGVYDD
jgi:hypothetical protein